MNATPAMCRIGIATKNDLPALCQLLASLFAQENEFSPSPSAQLDGLTAIVGNSVIGHILVARVGDDVVGMANLLYTTSTALGGRAALLEDVVVAAAHQGQGIGAQLLEETIRFARDQGCKRITLLTDSGNQKAQHFYRQHGFVESAMLPMRLVLD